MDTATQVSNARVPIEEYLQKSYRPYVEYIDGELKERPLVTYAHRRLQSLMSLWFGQHEDEWAVIVAVEVRTRVSPTRVRLPDVMIDRAGSKPSTIVDPPLIVIEILSPENSYTQTERLAQDYRKMGIPNIWLIDPETRTRAGRMCKEDVWIEVSRFEVAERPIYLDLNEQFARLDRYNKA